jgi:hypothetical protein
MKRGLLAIFCDEIEYLFSQKISTPRIFDSLELFLKSIDNEYLSRLITEVLQNQKKTSQIATLSYIHGNGFHKIILEKSNSFEVCLHVWLPETSAEENLHSHLCVFVSKILKGCLESELWGDSVNSNGKLYKEYAYSSKDKDLNETGLAKVEFIEKKQCFEGESYILYPDILHRIICHQKKEFVATLMIRSSPCRSFSRNVVINNNTPDIKPISLNTKNVKEILIELINQIKTK